MSSAVELAESALRARRSSKGSTKSAVAVEPAYHR
jgi:hypothetical protein